VRRSLVVLKALTYLPTGGMVAAPTTSLPEQIGGVRNWDYRYCWLRDATFTLYAMMNAGYIAEAKAWRDWLLRAVAGDPEKAQILYGVGGQRRVSEFELDWLPGYAGSRPVRVGNAAHEQFQLDVYGEVMDALHQARVRGLDPDDHAWSLQRTLMDFLEGAWDRPDEGIWEVRGPRRHFTHSKVLAWVAFDRAVQGVERFGLRGPVDRWRRVRQDIHDEVLREGFNVELNSFTQSYGSDELDASTLLIPILGFLPADDPRVVGTVDAVIRDLTRDGFVERYRVKEHNDVDGLPGGEGVFLPCSFWLVDALLMMARDDEARELFERLIGVSNDLGLLAEEYDPAEKRLLGNYPQAFTHVGLVNAAFNLSHHEGPMHQRPHRG
jgi:GH15 family glucan-1,4-alpha-glucosidase